MREKIISRRQFLKITGLSIPALSLMSVGCKFQEKPPNILFIMSDDHATNAISCYGSEIIHTPNIDRLANEGMKFNNCFCTNAICGPSRASILTGKYSHKNGFIVNELTEFDATQQTFPKLIQKAGYETAVVGKWHLGSEPTGFDYWNVLPGQGRYYDPVFIEMGKKVEHQGYVTDIITDMTIDWLKNRKSDQPFCLLSQHKAPHSNFQPAPEYQNWKVDQNIPEPPTLHDDYSTRSKAATDNEMALDPYLKLQYQGDQKLHIPEGLNAIEREKWLYQFFIKNYLGCIKSIDDGVGKILDYLDKSGLAENTVVIYTSDQGFFLGEHGWYDKRFMYDESLRMPLIIRYPKTVPAGRTSDNIVLNIDFAETFLDFAQTNIPPDMQGKSLKPLLTGKRPSDWRESMYYHFYEYPGWHYVKRHYGIRTNRYKLIHFYHDIDAWELYDLEKDPNEVNNVYNNPDYADLVNELTRELRRLQNKYGDSHELAMEFVKKYPRGSEPAWGRYENLQKVKR